MQLNLRWIITFYVMLYNYQYLRMTLDTATWYRKTCSYSLNMEALLAYQKNVILTFPTRGTLGGCEIQLYFLNFQYIKL